MNRPTRNADRTWRSWIPILGSTHCTVKAIWLTAFCGSGKLFFPECQFFNLQTKNTCAATQVTTQVVLKQEWSVPPHQQLCEAVVSNGCGSGSRAGRPLTRGLIPFPSLCILKCPWAWCWTPNCPWMLCRQCMNGVNVCVNRQMWDIKMENFYPTITHLSSIW